MKNYQRQRMPDPGAHWTLQWVWAEINRQRASQEDVAARSGVASSTMRKWRKRERSPRLMDVEAVVNSLGYRLKIVPIPDKE